MKDFSKTEMIYLDDKDNIVDESLATKAIIRYLDEQGNLVNEDFMAIINDNVTSKKGKPVELSQEDIDFMKSFGLDVDFDTLDIVVKKNQTR